LIYLVIDNNVPFVSLTQESNYDFRFFLSENNILNIEERSGKSFYQELYYLKNRISDDSILSMRRNFIDIFNLSFSDKKRMILYFKVCHLFLDILYSRKLDLYHLNILADLDGTLSASRTPISKEIMVEVYDLSTKYNFNLGILTGSGLSFVMEQLNYGENPIIAEHLYIYSCNGTKKYILNNKDIILNANEQEFIFSDFVGTNNHYYIVNYLLNKQIEIGSKLREFNLFPTGNFISDRGLLLNMCPLGRDRLSNERRESFVNSGGINIRKKIISEINEIFPHLNISAVLGGDTSIDIFPKECGKEHVLMYPEMLNSNVYFIGDRTMDLGNDQSLYLLLNQARMSDSTSSPEETVCKIKSFLKKYNGG
jgi:hydroxymethylpyrimidine pyrophosphatase-like HAD family hydrolase